jgi:hypothetical protein
MNIIIGFKSDEAVGERNDMTKNRTDGQKNDLYEIVILSKSNSIQSKV